MSFAAGRNFSKLQKSAAETRTGSHLNFEFGDFPNLLLDTTTCSSVSRPTTV